MKWEKFCYFDPAYKIYLPDTSAQSRRPSRNKWAYMSVNTHTYCLFLYYKRTLKECTGCIVKEDVWKRALGARNAPTHVHCMQIVGRRSLFASLIVLLFFCTTAVVYTYISYLRGDIWNGEVKICDPMIFLFFNLIMVISIFVDFSRDYLIVYFYFSNLFLLVNNVSM